MYGSTTLKNRKLLKNVRFVLFTFSMENQESLEDGHFCRKVISRKVISQLWSLDTTNVAVSLHTLTLQKHLWYLTKWVTFRCSVNVFKIIWKLGAVFFWILVEIAPHPPCSYVCFMRKERECGKLPCCTVKTVTIERLCHKLHTSYLWMFVFARCECLDTEMIDATEIHR